MPGGYSVEVKQLAQAHTLNSKVFTNTTDTVGTGTLTVQYGTYSGSFTANADKASQTVTIDSAHSTLGGIRDAINAANIGVIATILNDGTGNRLVLVSKDHGRGQQPENHRQQRRRREQRRRRGPLAARLRSRRVAG